MTKKTPPSKVRIQDVARAAGLSIATVSRVVNGTEKVGSDLYNRVVQAASELGFDIANKNDSRIVAFLLSNRPVLHTFHSAVLVGAEAHCAANNFGVLFLPVQYSPNPPWRQLPLPRLLQNRRIVRGVIAAGTNSQNLLDALADRRLPVVCLGNNVVGEWDSERFSAVFFDDIGGTQEATAYLRSLGHREIWYIGNCRHAWYARRRDGYERAMEEGRLPSLVRDVNIDSTEDLGYVGTKSILSEGRSITAIVAGGDGVACGAYRALADHGLKVPADVSVVGMGNSTEALALNPALTSVHVFAEEVGKHMAELLLQQVSCLDAKPQALTLPTRLIRRESCRVITQPEVAVVLEQASAS